jgi:hypothetical protein
VTVDGERDILGLWAGEHGDGEGDRFRMRVLSEIKNRGTQNVCRLVFFDPEAEIGAAAVEILGGVSWVWRASAVITAPAMFRSSSRGEASPAGCALSALGWSARSRSQEPSRHRPGQDQCRSPHARSCPSTAAAPPRGPLAAVIQPGQQIGGNIEDPAGDRGERAHPRHDRARAQRQHGR